MIWKIPLADLDYGLEEENAVLDVVRRRWLTMGAVTQEFETEFANFVGVPHALGVSNATVALHLACLAVGLGPGDEAIVPSLTFVATANAVLYTGAEVRFADVIGLEDMNISPEAIERMITPRTKAIVVVHYGGYPCRMSDILAIASKHGLAVIEDAAHAPGAYLNERHLGTLGDVGCFSFFSNKNLSVGEGGMLVTNREDIAKKVSILRSHGMTTVTWDRHRGHAHSYDVVDLGYNYRIDEIRSALGLVQLKRLRSGNKRRQEITRQYWKAFAELDIVLPFADVEVEYGRQPSYHIMPILLPMRSERTVFIDAMKAAGVQTSIHYPPIHMFSYYKGRYPEISLPCTEAISVREVTLPLYPGMTREMVEYVVSAVRSSLDSSLVKSH